MSTSNRLIRCFARYRFTTCKQRLGQMGQSLEDFIQCRKRVIGSECNFALVIAAQHRKGAIRDAFITGIISLSVRQIFDYASRKR